MGWARDVHLRRMYFFLSVQGGSLEGCCEIKLRLVGGGCSVGPSLCLGAFLLCVCVCASVNLWQQGEL